MTPNCSYRIGKANGFAMTRISTCSLLPSGIVLNLSLDLFCAWCCRILLVSTQLLDSLTFLGLGRSEDPCGSAFQYRCLHLLGGPGWSIFLFWGNTCLCLPGELLLFCTVPWYTPLLQNLIFDTPQPHIQEPCQATRKCVALKICATISFTLVVMQHGWVVCCHLAGNYYYPW